MKQYQIKFGKLKGEITIPPSKSQTLRAILFASLAYGKSVIHHYLESPDTFAMIAACRIFGAKIDLFSDRLEIDGVSGKIQPAEDVINAGNSGIVLRFCSGIGGMSRTPVVITGDYSIRHHRPMKALLEGLNQFGVSALSMRGDHFAPVIIQGPYLSNNAIINGEDSQPVSALLIASAFADFPIQLGVTNPGEKPWVQLTLNWFERLGIGYSHQNYNQYSLLGSARVEGFEYIVPKDYTSASYPIAAALITQSELILNDIDLTDAQGDKEIISVFQKMGACIEIDHDKQKIRVKKSPHLKGIAVDINNFIDGITILAVVACFAEGQTHIFNAAVAKQKECNRIQSIATELRKMGAQIEELSDGLIIHQSHLKGAVVHSYKDHRMAISLAIAGLKAKGETLIHDVSCVNKTYPTFVRDFSAIGASIEEKT